MEFNSIDFMIFFPVVLAVYFVIPKKLRTVWLLIASYYFYMSWNAKYALLIGFSTIATYFCSILADRYNDRAKLKKAVVAACIIVNFAILAVFKYGNFFIDSVDSLLGALGIVRIDRRLDLMLPVGISFYTFQAVGYVIDVYRGDVKAERNFIKYALFVSFFPQLVAGPIERSKNLLSQIHGIADIKLWNARRITGGAILMVWGFFMKMVIADRLALFVNTVFASYRTYGTIELSLAVLGFLIQVYCDFGSYSLIAIGSSRIMGITLMENFISPFFSGSLNELWRRWHISLTSWFRDYLYIPLGGNRKGIVRKYINMMAIFVASGLWHGANWTFVIWGTLHGLFVVIEQITKKTREKILKACDVNTECFSWRLLRTCITTILFAFPCVFFRSQSVGDAFILLRRLFVRFDPWVLFDGSMFELGLNRQEMSILIVSLIVLTFVDYIRYKKEMLIDAWLFTQNIWFEWTAIILLIAAIFVFGQYGYGFDPQQFVYFQF